MSLIFSLSVQLSKSFLPLRVEGIIDAKSAFANSGSSSTMPSQNVRSRFDAFQVSSSRSSAARSRNVRFASSNFARHAAAASCMSVTIFALTYSSSSSAALS